VEGNLMYFRDHVITEGTNVTIRRGDKWESLNPGDEIVLLETGTAIDMGIGVVKETMYCPYNEVPQYALDANQERLKVMYTDFDPSQFVTVVMFEVKK